MGFCLQTPMGLQAYTPTETKAWCEMMKVELLPCEFEQIMPLSVAYINAIKDHNGVFSADSPYMLAIDED